MDEQLYVVRNPSGCYFSHWRDTGYATVPLWDLWTRDKAKARQWSLDAWLAPQDAALRSDLQKLVQRWSNLSLEEI